MNMYKFYTSVKCTFCSVLYNSSRVCIEPPFAKARLEIISRTCLITPIQPLSYINSVFKIYNHISDGNGFHGKKILNGCAPSCPNPASRLVFVIKFWIVFDCE